MNTTLCIDFGNTRQKAALFENNILKDIFYFEDDLVSQTRLLVQKWPVQRAIFASVINHPSEVETILQAAFPTHILNATSKLPFTTPVGKRSSIGADRLALCAAATLLYANQNNLIIGLGSAVTYNFVNTRNQFLGGGISPGMHMRMKALNNFTALLPIVEPHWNVPLIGYDTDSNIQSGVVLGLALEIDGFIERYKQQYRSFNVLLTGGDLIHLYPHIKNGIFADSELLFKGLYAICEQNMPTI